VDPSSGRKRVEARQIIWGFAPKIKKLEKQKISPPKITTHHSQKQAFLLIKSHTFNKIIK
jgi:hypothetical protein